jgi:hypothetical protein
MTNHVVTLSLNSLRGTDSNSLLRLYDEVQGTLKQSPSQLEREKAEKAIQRITTELRKRNVRLVLALSVRAGRVACFLVERANG